MGICGHTHKRRRRNYITPVTAAVLNVVGSMIVVFNSARLVREGEEFETFESEDEETENAPDGTEPPADVAAEEPAELVDA